MTALANAPRTRWWYREGDRIICDLCPRECRLGEGQRGFCFVRQNLGGRMQLTTYGKSTGFCVDPIEKKPLHHFLPGTPVLSFGTAGCNLGCKFCQNWDISKSRQTEILSQAAEPEAIVQLARETGSRSIAFTYNDPVIWAEYAIDTARIARREGIRTVAVTAGYITEAARPDFYAEMDAVNVDLKAFTEQFYRKLAFAHLQPVLETLRWLKRETEIWFEITNLVIPTQNDSPDELRRLASWVVENVGPDVPLHFSAFHPNFKMRDLPRTPPETLRQACEIAQSEGIRFAYAGNVADRAWQNTSCPDCGTVLIERDRYELGAYRLRDGNCATCSRPTPGVFEDAPGVWGRKRHPLRIREKPALKTTFDAGEQRAMLRAARGWVESAVRGGTSPPELPHELAGTRVWGIFTTLKRGSVLRGCVGNWSESGERLETLLRRSAEAVASRDRRFPAIDAEELDFLTLEVSPLFEPEPVSGRAEERLKAVEVGRHGLILEAGRRRGVLLPQVAMERGWDAATFLDQVCAKAGVPAGTWKDPRSTLKVFRGLQFKAASRKREIGRDELTKELFGELGRALCAAEGRDEALENRAFQTWTGLVLATERGRAFAISESGTLADLVDPASDISGNELGQFLYFAALVTLATMGGVERVVGSTISTFDSIPVGSATLTDAPLSLLIGVLSSSMDVALRVSMPVVTIIFLETVAVGFIMKTVPTLNIMSFGFPLRIVMGLFVFVVSFGALHAVLTSELGVVLMAIEEWAASPWR